MTRRRAAAIGVLAAVLLGVLSWPDTSQLPGFRPEVSPDGEVVRTGPSVAIPRFMQSEQSEPEDAEAVVEEDVDADGLVEVRCAIDEPVPDDAVLIVWPPEGPWQRSERRDWQLDGDSVVFEAREGARATLRHEGAAIGGIRIADGACTLTRYHSRISGFVYGVPEDDGVWLRGCGVGKWVDGAFSFPVKGGVRCRLFVTRRDGVFRVTDEIGLEVPVDGDVTDVELFLPEQRQGGMGVELEELGWGKKIVRVVPGSPAFRAGIEAGDVIVSIDGDDTAEMSMDEFIQDYGLGDAGTDVDVDVEGPDGQLRELTLRRALLQ